MLKDRGLTIAIATRDNPELERTLESVATAFKGQSHKIAVLLIDDSRSRNAAMWNSGLCERVASEAGFSPRYVGQEVLSRVLVNFGADAETRRTVRLGAGDWNAGTCRNIAALVSKTPFILYLDDDVNLLAVPNSLEDLDFSWLRSFCCLRWYGLPDLTNLGWTEAYQLFLGKRLGTHAPPTLLRAMELVDLQVPQMTQLLSTFPDIDGRLLSANDMKFDAYRGRFHGAAVVTRADAVREIPFPPWWGEDFPWQAMVSSRYGGGATIRTWGFVHRGQPRSKNVLDPRSLSVEELGKLTNTSLISGLVTAGGVSSTLIASIRAKRIALISQAILHNSALTRSAERAAARDRPDQTQNLRILNLIKDSLLAVRQFVQDMSPEDILAEISRYDQVRQTWKELHRLAVDHDPWPP